MGSYDSGETWDEVIEAALDGARCVVVLWSRYSVQSSWVRTEADEGQRRRVLIPALLDDVVIPLAFRRIQAANLPELLRSASLKSNFTSSRPSLFSS